MLPDVIETTRMVIRRWRFSDVPEVFAYWQDPKISLYLEGPAEPPSEGDTSMIIARHILTDGEERDVWAITIDDRAIGGMLLNYAKGHRVAEINYHIKKALWGQGLATEAISAVVGVAFKSRESLQRIEATVHPMNIGSFRALRRVGFSHEGTLRSNALVRGEVSNEEIYSILRTDWNKRSG